MQECHVVFQDAPFGGVLHGSKWIDGMLCTFGIVLVRSFQFNGYVKKQTSILSQLVCTWKSCLLSIYVCRDASSNFRSGTGLRVNPG